MGKSRVGAADASWLPREPVHQFVSTSDNQQRPTVDRVEFSGPDQLDRVLIHLREARDRARSKGKPGRAGAVEEKLSFDRAPAVAPPAPPAEPQASPAEPQRDARPREPVAPPASLDVPPHIPPEAVRLGTAPPAPSQHAAPSPRQPRTGLAAGRIAAAAAERLTKGLEDTPARVPRPPAPAAKAKAGPSVGTSASALGRSELVRAALESMPSFKAIGWFSFVSNILMLAGPLFMLQVYDRVMTSGSMPTLVVLSLMTAAVYVVIGVLDLIRSRIIVRIGVELDQRVSERVFASSLRRSLAQPGSSVHALRELDQLRQFISGPGPLTFFDAPWTPVYLLVIFLTHWTLGVAATIGALVLLALAWASEARSRHPLMESGKASNKSLELAESGQRNAEAITAMGMLRSFMDRWQATNRDSLGWQVLASDRLSGLSAASKALRLLLQSMMLAIGAALAINGQISAGAIIAATIIFGRALAPVEQAVGHWRGFVKARESFEKLQELLHTYPEPPKKTSLPPPKGRLEARGLRVMSPDGRTTILQGVSFAVEPGQMVAIIGPSASGKSSLVRALVGLWPSAGGEVLVDGARLVQWNADELGRYVGYLPQSVELFAGTVRENIARFSPSATDASVVEAARAAHAHDMIMALPKGYDTELGAYGAYLSAGQRQRIGLARALYGDPVLVVLDEPNANLDRTGDEALAAAIDGMRARGRAVVLVSHRVQAIGKADLLLYLERGQQRAFGPREDVLRFLQQGQQGQQRPGGQGGAPANSGQTR